MRRDNKLLYAVVISDGSERWRIVQDEASAASWTKELCLEQRKATCPCFINARQLSMGHLLKWLIDKQQDIQGHFGKESPQC